MKRWLAAICAAVLFGMLWRVPAVCAAEEPEIPAAAYALMVVTPPSFGHLL